MALLRSIFVFSLLCVAPVLRGKELQEEFSEELLLRPLPDRKVLAHFHFESTVPPTETYGRHHHLFPKAIYQLVHKYRVREMELSFTQGRWNYERWGGYDPLSSKNAKPPGVELWAVFDVPLHQVDASWKNLTHTLSGLFCASINFLESSTTYSAPDWGFRPFSGNLRYGTLPREAVCTENLTPWLKLLPCRDKAGISALMDRPSIYRGFYHSQRLHLTSTEFDSTEMDSGIVLEQTLTVVLQPISVGTGAMYSSGSIVQPNWSLGSLLGRKISGKCVLAKSSNVYVQLESGLVSELRNILKETEESGGVVSASVGPWMNQGFDLSVSPDSVLREASSLHKEPSILYKYSIEKYSDSKPFDLAMTWNFPVLWSSPQPPLHASRFLMGSGNERGAIAISLKPTGSMESSWNADTNEDKCRLRVNIFQVAPWYVKMYYHTLQVFVNEQPQSVADVVEKMRVSPSEDKVSPGVMEMALILPCGVKLVALTLEFDKGFLHIDDYPPDANQGFDIPSALVSFPEFQSSMRFLRDDTLEESPMVSKMQLGSLVQLYTEVLLVPLTTPDFSMPYNVITITCTVFALYFGSLLNALRRRVGEEERILKNKAGKLSGLPLLLSKLSAKLRGRQEPTQSPATSSSFISRKLIFKVILVASVAACWQYYFR